MPTLAQYRQALAPELGPYSGSLTTTSLAADTLTLVCTTLIDADVPGSEWSQGWVYVTSGAQAAVQRRLARTPVDGDTGTLNVTRDYAAAIASGVTFEVATRLPFARDGRHDGMHECINRALSVIWVRDRLSISGVSDQYEYALTSYPWLTHARRIIRLLNPIAVAGTIPTMYSGDWRVREDGESFVLELPGAPFRTGETFFVDVIRPANSRLRQSGTWTDQTNPNAGLAAEADEAVPPVRLVVRGALYYAYKELGKQARTAGEIKDWEMRTEAQARIFAAAKRNYLYQDDGLGVLRVTSGGGDWMAAL